MLPYPGMAWDMSFLELLGTGFINQKPNFCDEKR